MMRLPHYGVDKFARYRARSAWPKANETFGQRCSGAMFNRSRLYGLSPYPVSLLQRSPHTLSFIASGYTSCEICIDCILIIAICQVLVACYRDLDSLPLPYPCYAANQNGTGHDFEAGSTFHFSFIALCCFHVSVHAPIFTEPPSGRGIYGIARYHNQSWCHRCTMSGIRHPDIPWNWR